MANIGRRTHFWRDQETNLMLKEMKNLNILHLTNRQRHRNGDMLNKVSSKLVKTSFTQNVRQIRCAGLSLLDQVITRKTTRVELIGDMAVFQDEIATWRRRAVFSHTSPALTGEDAINDTTLTGSLDKLFSVMHLEIQITDWIVWTLFLVITLLKCK